MYLRCIAFILQTKQLEVAYMTKVQDYTGAYLEQSLEQLLEEIVVSIKGLYKDCRIILFGSFARGEQTKDSDLDICVLVPELTDRRLEMVVDVKIAIKHIKRMLSSGIDVLVFTQSEWENEHKDRTTLLHTIYQEGVVLAG